MILQSGSWSWIVGQKFFFMSYGSFESHCPRILKSLLKHLDSGLSVSYDQESNNVWTMNIALPCHSMITYHSYIFIIFIILLWLSTLWLLIRKIPPCQFRIFFMIHSKIYTFFLHFFLFELFSFFTNKLIYI